MRTYYNEIEPYCVEWIGNLIGEGIIGGGFVDGRSIRDVQGDDLEGYGRCHFFSGVAA